MERQVYLEPVPDGDVSIARCSECKEQFHSSPVGPRKCMAAFPDHVKQMHPHASIGRPPWVLFGRRAQKKS